MPSKWIMRQQELEAQTQAQPKEVLLLPEYIDPPAKDADKERLYTLLEGETIWRVARRFGVSAEELAEHNNIEKGDMFGVGQGDTLHLPLPQEFKNEPVIEYELLAIPKKMHVIKDNGTRKMAFGNAKTFDDISPTGPAYAVNTNVTVNAVAHVPLIENGERVTAAYFMDFLALGNYRETGQVAYNIGFNHSHLEDGHVDIVKPKVGRPKAPEVEPTKIEQEIISDVAQMDETRVNKIRRVLPPAPEASPVVEKLLDPTKYPNYYKTTLTPLNDEQEPVMYVANQNMYVKELDSHRPDRPLAKNQSVRIKYTVEKEGVLYGVPASHDQTGFFYGIPMDLITPEDEVFRTEYTLPERLELHGHLTLAERYLTVPLSKAMNRPWIKYQLDKIKNKEK